MKIWLSLVTLLFVQGNSFAAPAKADNSACEDQATLVELAMHTWEDHARLIAQEDFIEEVGETAMGITLDRLNAMILKSEREGKAILSRLIDDNQNAYEKADMSGVATKVGIAKERAILMAAHPDWKWNDLVQATPPLTLALAKKALDDATKAEQDSQKKLYPLLVPCK